MISAIQRWATERGYRIATGGVTVLQEVKSELDTRRRSGELERSFQQAYLDSFCYERSSNAIGDPRAVLMVAMPRPAHRLVFEFEDGPFATILPPTYLRYRPLFETLRDDLTAEVPELRDHLEMLQAPLKLISCRLGLTSYGRNNVTYIPGWGSYLQLLGYVSDVDIGVPADWTPVPARLMPECEGCDLCASACPTGAINDDRILLHAECCTTLISESEGDLRGPLSARCLFGCLECQEICPVNKGLLRVESAGVNFNRRETEKLLAGQMDTGIQEKLRTLGLTEQSLIARNLRSLLSDSA